MMKISKIIFFIMILIISLSCVSASDNATQSLHDNNTISTGDAEIANEINVTFDEKVYEQELTNITVEIPENTSGNLELRINDYTFFNQSVNSSVNIPMELPPQKFPVVVPNVWPPFDSSIYKVSAFFNDVELDVNHDLIVMKYPKDHSPVFLIPEEVLQFGKSYAFMPAVLFPRSAGGVVEVYLDEKLINRTSVKGPFVYLNETLITSLGMGTHKLMMNYSGDDYFLPYSGILTFNVTNAVIGIPQSIYLDHDDCITVDTQSSGYVSVYVDSKLVKKGALDKKGEFLYSLFKDVTCGEHEIMVVVSAKDFTRTKTVKANVTYSMNMDSYSTFRYGQNNHVSVYMPHDMSLNLFKVTINNKTATAKKEDNYLLIDISNLAVGNYTVSVTYLGDTKYYPMSVSGNFSVAYEIDIPYFADFNCGSAADIILPSDANGSFEIYLNGVLYKSVKLTNGKASIKLDNLNPGKYNISARYVGSDYDVDEKNATLIGWPDMTYETTVRVGDKNVLHFKIPKNCKGSISLKIGQKTYSSTIKNGVATIDLSKLSVGDWDFDLNYVGSDGYNETYFIGVYVSQVPIKIVALNNKLTYGVGTYKVKVTGTDGKIVKNALVTFKINGKTFKKVKTNSLGIASVKIPTIYAPKLYSITAVYKNAVLTKKVLVNHLITLKVSKKSSKLIISAKALKGKVVVFKVGGKTFKVKTNKLGVAKIIVKNPKVKKLVVGASYLKDSVRKIIVL